MSGPEFELALVQTEYANAVKSLVAASTWAAKYQRERDEARAALLRIGSIVDEPHAALVVDRVRAALKAGLS